MGEVSCAGGLPGPQDGVRDIVLAHAVGADGAALLAALNTFDAPGFRVGHDVVVLPGDVSCEVSTVSLEWERPPAGFETMIFVEGRGARFAQRYLDRPAAAAGHEQVVADVRAGLLDDRLLR